MTGKAIWLNAFALTSMTLTGCAGLTSQDTGCAVGGGVLGVAGVLVGDKLDKHGDMGKIIGGLTGAATGCLIGKAIAQYLTTEEQQKANESTQKALDSDQVGKPSTTRWQSPTQPNVGGGTTITKTSQSSDGRLCKTAENVLFYKGQDITQTETYCRDKRTGQWQLL